MPVKEIDLGPAPAAVAAARTKQSRYTFVPIEGQITGDTLSKASDDNYNKRVALFYNWLKTATPAEREGSAITRFANPLGLGKWLSNKFGTGDASAWFDALDAYTGELSWKDPEKWKHFLVGAEQAALTFKGLGAAGVPGVAPKFAAYEAIQAPREGETLTKRAAAVGKGAAFGFAVGQAGKYIPKARYRMPTTVGGAMLVTKLGGGSAKQVLDAGAQMFGWEVIGLFQQGANRRAIIKAARKHNPELRNVPDAEVLRSVKQLADIQKALPKMKPSSVKLEATPAEKSGMLAPEITAARKAAIAAHNAAVSKWIAGGKKGPAPTLPEAAKPPAPLPRSRAFYENKLKNPELAKKAPAFETYAGEVVAVPVGKSRKSGTFDAAYTVKSDAMQIYNALKGKKGFPKLRIEKEGTSYEIKWGEPTEQYRGDFQKMGEMFGYTDAAIKDFTMSWTPTDLAELPFQQAQNIRFEQVRSELTSGLKTAKKLVKGIVSKEYAVERARRAEQFERYKERLIAKGVPTGEALMRARGAFKGQLLEKPPDYEPPRLKPQQWETISRQIDRSGKFKTYEKTRAQEATLKLQNGRLLQDNEIELLSRILGEDFAKAALKLQPWNVRMWREIEDVLNFPKFAAAYDVQMARQGAWIRARHPILYARAVGKNVKGYFSNKQADKIRLDYESDPLHEQAKSDGVVFIEREGIIPSGRIEQYRSRIATKLPFGLGRGYKASQRGFVEGFNWTQQKLYSQKYNSWLDKGIEITPKMRRNLVDFNNTILGMKRPEGNFGRSATRVLSPVMWSPTLTYSRIATPAMILTNPTMRGEVAATLSSYIASGLLVMYAASKFNKKAKVEWNPLSTDFGKVKVGNTRFDVYGDGGPYIRTLIQGIRGKKKTEAGKIVDKPTMETLIQFARNKRNAWIDLVLRIWTGKMYYGGSTWEIEEDVGKKLNLDTPAKKVAYLGGRELVRTFLPFFLNAVVEASYNDNWPTGLAAGAAEFFSQTTISYKPSKYTKLQQLRDVVSDMQFDKEWDNLAPLQQEALRMRYKELQQGEEELQLERAKRESDYEYVAKQIVEEKKAGKNVYKMLKPELQQALDSHGIALGLSRRVGDWYMNDDRYKRYQDLTVKAMNRLKLDRISQSNLPFEQREQMIRMMINIAKKAARTKLVAETYPKKAG